MSRVISEYMAGLAKKKARKMSPADRRALALKMNMARWAKARAVKAKRGAKP